MGIWAKYEIEERFRALASKILVAIAANVYLYRDKGRTTRLELRPRSIMIPGGRERWRPAAEHRVASAPAGDIRGAITRIAPTFSPRAVC